ncbi:MAG: NAD(P)/FAD-dependent oxidoreductase [Chloroflexia bacterium]|nr:NAD(P)/FAD-dependent oxidoreductase [Chloroflexia bacterium]
MRYVIVGNGIAGITAAIDLARRESGEVEIYTQEPFPYYYRPRLHEFLGDELPQEKLYVRPQSWYQKRGIQVGLNARVEHLDPENHTIVLADGHTVPYDRLLLATGAVSFVPPVPGAEQEGVFPLRSLQDALNIKAYAASCPRAVVIGCGLLGIEAASGLKKLGLETTVLEIAPRVLPRQLDDAASDVLRGIIGRLGLSIAVDARTERILGSGRAEGVRLSDGREFPAGLILIAAGVRSDVRLAQEAGLVLDRGLVVDEHMATSAPDVYAAGDVAVFQGQFWGIIPVALAQARVAAANMAGEPKLYEAVVPSNTLNVVGVDLTSAGTVLPEEGSYEEVRCALPDQGIYRKLVLQDGVVMGTIVIGDKDMAQEAASLVTNRARLSLAEARRLCNMGA